MPNNQSKPSRRGFFAGAVGASAAVALVAKLGPAGTAPAAAVAPMPAPAKGGGYQLTEHVRRYYQTTLV